MTFIVKPNNKNLQIVIQADFLCDVLEYVQNDNDDIWEKGQPPPLLNVQVNKCAWIIPPYFRPTILYDLDAFIIGTTLFYYIILFKFSK